MSGTRKHSRLRLVSLACVALFVLGSATPAFSGLGDQTPLNPDILAATARVKSQKFGSITIGDTTECSTRPADSRSTSKYNVGNKSFEQTAGNYRQELATMGETYSDSRTNTVIDSFMQQPDGTVKALATETTHLTIEESNSETGYTALHKLTFSPLYGGKWENVEDKCLEPTGLLPLGKAVSLIAPNADYFNDAAVNISFAGVTPASAERATSTDSEEKGVLCVGGCNYTAMDDYLEKYRSNYKPVYRSFGNSGGDCTNFAGQALSVSQALSAGGWPDYNGEGTYYRVRR